MHGFLGKKQYAVNKQPLEESFADISLAPDELAIEELHERLALKGLAVIDITWGNHEVKQFPLFVANQMQLEPKEPAHGAFASLSDALECLVDMNALVPANSQRGDVNEADSCTLAQQAYLAAIHSISTIAPLGKVLTATAERAGNGALK